MKLLRTIVAGLLVAWLLSKIAWWILGAIFPIILLWHYLVRLVGRLVIGALIFIGVCALLGGKD